VHGRTPVILAEKGNVCSVVRSEGLPQAFNTGSLYFASVCRQGTLHSGDVHVGDLNAIYPANVGSRSNRVHMQAAVTFLVMKRFSTQV
jgi:hypothetical protein